MLDVAALPARGRRTRSSSSAWPTPRTSRCRYERRSRPTSSSSRRPPACGAKARGRRPDDVVAQRAARASAAVLDDVPPRRRPPAQHLPPAVAVDPARRSRPAGVPAVMTLHDYKLACPTYQFLDHGELCEACLPHRFCQPSRRRCKDGSLAASARGRRRVGAAPLHRAPTTRCAGSSARAGSCAAKMRQGRVFPDRLRCICQLRRRGATARPRRRRAAASSSPAGCPPRRASTRSCEAAALADPAPRSTSPATAPSGRPSRRSPPRSAPGRVRFHGRLPADEVADLLRARGRRGRALALVREPAAGRARGVRARGAGGRERPRRAARAGRAGRRRRARARRTTPPRSPRRSAPFVDDPDRAFEMGARRG